MATTEQMDTIEHRRVDDTARAMMTEGITLDWDQADALGDSGCDWLRTRLGLVSTTDEGGVRFEPRERAGSWSVPRPSWKGCTYNS
jgi:hypothetical protein